MERSRAQRQAGRAAGGGRLENEEHAQGNPPKYRVTMRLGIYYVGTRYKSTADIGRIFAHPPSDIWPWG